MSKIRPSLLAASAAMMLAAGAGTFANATDPAMQQARAAVSGTQSTAKPAADRPPSRLGERNSIAKAMFGGFGISRSRRFPNGPGWTHAHVARMKSKRKNQARNKRAHRG